MSRAQAFCWHNMFSEARTHVEDEQRSGRPTPTGNRWQHSTGRRKCSIWSKNNRMISDEANLNRVTVRLILTEELGTRKNCAQMVPRNRTEQQLDAGLKAVFDIQMHYGDGAASLLTWSRSLPLLCISEGKIGSKRTSFWVNRRHPEVCDAGLRQHPTKCVPGMLQTIAAPLEKVCTGTRDVPWRWLYCSWWINKIKLFFGTSLITLLPDRVKRDSIDGIVQHSLQ